MRALASVFAVTLLALAPSQVRGDEAAAKREAKKFLGDGDALFAKGEYEAALSAYQQAYAAFPSSKIYYPMAQAEEQLGRTVEAQRAFKRRLREAASSQTAPALLRERISAALAQEALPRPIPIYRRPAFVVPVSLAAAASLAAVMYFSGSSNAGSEIIALAIDHLTHEQQPDVQGDGPKMRAYLINRQIDARLDVLAEACPFRGEGVGARIERRNEINARVVGYRPLDEAGVGVPHTDLHSGECGSVGVRNQTG